MVRLLVVGCRHGDIFSCRGGSRRGRSLQERRLDGSRRYSPVTRDGMAGLRRKMQDAQNDASPKSKVNKQRNNSHRPPALDRGPTFPRAQLLHRFNSSINGFCALFYAVLHACSSYHMTCLSASRTINFSISLYQLE